MKIIKYKLIVDRINQDTGIFQDVEFVKFCEEHQIVHVDKKFFNSGVGACGSLLLEYVTKKKQNTPTEGVGESKKEQYDKLSDWLNELASNEGLSAFIIPYNTQIAELVEHQPEPFDAMQLIKGMKAKLA